MNTLTIVLVIALALLGYPAGLLIARMTKEELRAGRKWFLLIICSCVLGIIVSLIFARAEALLFLSASFVFIALVALASLLKSRVKKKKRGKKG